MIDPLRAIADGAFVAGPKRAIPLIASRHDVRIAPGFAIVSTTRTFRNEEPESIEATVTFPIGSHRARIIADLNQQLANYQAVKGLRQRPAAYRDLSRLVRYGS